MMTIIMSTISKNKPDITIRENREGRRLLVDTAISVGRNVIKKEAEKILKYEDLEIEIQHMCNEKTKVIPVARGGQKEPSKNLPQNTRVTYRENTKSRNYRKQPYWALHTYCGKC